MEVNKLIDFIFLYQLSTEKLHMVVKTCQLGKHFGLPIARYLENFQRVPDHTHHSVEGYRCISGFWQVMMGLNC